MIQIRTFYDEWGYIAGYGDYAMKRPASDVASEWLEHNSHVDVKSIMTDVVGQRVVITVVYIEPYPLARTPDGIPTTPPEGS